MYLRQGALLIYEFISVHNKQNSIISPILKSQFPDIYELYRQEFVKVRDFKKEYNYTSELARLRNNTIAHINDDVFSYCYMISEIHPTLLKKGIIKFLYLLMDIEKMQMKVEEEVVNKVLALDGKTLNDIIQKKYPLPKMKKLKIPKLLK